MSSFFNFLILYITLPVFTQCLILKGELVSNKDWVLLGKFCFISQESSFVFNVSYPETYKVQNMLLYYDDQWTNVLAKNDLTCELKEKELTMSQTLNLSTQNPGLGCSLTEINGVNSISCNSRRIFATIRARYWFIVISRCGSSGVRLNYEMELTNGADSFRKHFSADEFGILETSITFFLLYLIMFIVCCVFAKILITKFLFHITVRLFIVSIIFQLIAFLFMLAEYGQLSLSGYIKLGMVTTSRVFEAIGQIIFLVLLIFVAKGYTVTRNKLRIATWIKIGIFFAIYVIAYILAFIFSEALYDIGKVNYYYNSPGGIAVVLIKMLLGWIWFSYSVFFTIKNYPEKRIFYIVFTITFSIWFIIGPCLILICNFFIPDYTRQFVAYIIQSIIVFLGHFIFLVLIRPTAENKLFPYHVQTNQIGDGNYPHHKDEEGGNTKLDDVKTNMENLFVIKNTGGKYQVDSFAELSKSVDE